MFEKGFTGAGANGNGYMGAGRCSSMEKKWIILLVVLLLIAACSFSGCAKAVSKAKFLKAGDAVADAASTYTDSDTLSWNWMQTYELYGETGTEFRIHYKGNAPVDLMILDVQNYNIYNRAVDSGRYTTKINGKFWLNKNEVNIVFTQPDTRQYYLVIDNTDLFSNGAKSGRSVTYSLTLT